MPSGNNQRQQIEGRQSLPIRFGDGDLYGVRTPLSSMQDRLQIQAVPPVLVKASLQHHRVVNIPVQRQPGGQSGPPDRFPVLNGDAGAVHLKADRIPLFLSALVQLKGVENGRFFVLLPVVCAFTTDIGAYFFGVFLGKHRGITQVSPNKSLEGYVGGILSGCLFMLVYGLLVQNFGGLPVKLPVMALYGLLGSAITEIGDLSFSLIKRQCAVKDYGTLLPGHGGMLDRFDSTIFAAPMLLLLVEILPAF